MANAKFKKQLKLYHYVLDQVTYVAKVTAIKAKITYWHNSFPLITV